jgi:hypothetical protein
LDENGELLKHSENSKKEDCVSVQRDIALSSMAGFGVEKEVITAFLASLSNLKSQS